MLVDVIKAKIVNLEAALRVLEYGVIRCSNHRLHRIDSPCSYSIEEERERNGDSAYPDATRIFAITPQTATAELDQALSFMRRQLRRTKETLAR